MQTVEIPLSGILPAMEAAGICVDAAALNEYAAEVEKQLDSVDAQCFAAAGRTFNLNSTAEVRADTVDDGIGVGTVSIVERRGCSSEVGAGWEGASQPLQPPPHYAAGSATTTTISTTTTTTVIVALPGQPHPV